MFLFLQVEGQKFLTENSASVYIEKVFQEDKCSFSKLIFSYFWGTVSKAVNVNVVSVFNQLKLYNEGKRKLEVADKVMLVTPCY